MASPFLTAFDRATDAARDLLAFFDAGGEYHESLLAALRDSLATGDFSFGGERHEVSFVAQESRLELIRCTENIPRSMAQGTDTPYMARIHIKWSLSGTDVPTGEHRFLDGIAVFDVTTREFIGVRSKGYWTLKDVKDHDA